MRAFLMIDNTQTIVLIYHQVRRVEVAWQRTRGTGASSAQCH